MGDFFGAVEGAEGLLTIGVIGLIAYLIYSNWDKIKASGIIPQGVGIVPITPGTTAPVQPGVTGGTTPLGIPYAVAKGSGALTLYAFGIDNPPQTFNLQSPIGPTGQSMQDLLNSGWSYSDVAEMIAMSQQNAYNSDAYTG